MSVYFKYLLPLFALHYYWLVLFEIVFSNDYIIIKTSHHFMFNIYRGTNIEKGAKHDGFMQTRVFESVTFFIMFML